MRFVHRIRKNKFARKKKSRTRVAASLEPSSEVAEIIQKRGEFAGKRRVLERAAAAANPELESF